MIDWTDIDSVLLDMDGTLLDLRFDTHFWLEHVPLRYGEARGLSLEDARAELLPRIRRLEGTLQWYCLDHWSRELGLDIAALKGEVAHLIATRPQARAFLRACRRAGKRPVLVTNAHRRSLELKLERTGLGPALDAVVCAHDLGVPKEQPAFWGRLQRREPFEPGRTLLIDDNLAVLRAARRFGIAHLLTIRRPDSRAPARPPAGEFPALESFAEIMP